MSEGKGLRAMAAVRWALLAVVVLVAAGTWWTFVLRAAAPAAWPERFYCPMHPQIRSSGPGSCPICYMKLEPIPEERLAGHVDEPAKAPAGSPGEPPPGLSAVMLTLERRQTVGIATEVAERKTVARQLRLPSVVEAPEKAVSEVRVRVEGFVEKVAAVETGAQVKAGQPLLWVYSPELLRAQEEFLTARNLATAGAAGSGPEGSLAARAVDAARGRLLLLGLLAEDVDRLATSKVAQRLVPIRALSAGTVTSRKVSPGALATPQMTLFEITDLSMVWVTATVSAADLASLGGGSSGEFTERQSGRRWPVSAGQLEPRLSNETRSARLRFLALNRDGALRPGAIGEVNARLPAQELLLVPRDAVVDLGTLHYAFVEQGNGLFSPRVVEPGVLVGEEREVLRGLSAGERVVARGSFVLDSESRLQSAVAPRPLLDAGPQ